MEISIFFMNQLLFSIYKANKSIVNKKIESNEEIGNNSSINLNNKIIDDKKFKN